MGKWNNNSKRAKSIARWQTWIALICVSLLYQALPQELYWGPRGLMIGLVCLLILPMVITHYRNNTHINHALSLCVNILVTSYMIMSVCRVVLAVLQGHIGPTHLFISSITLWSTNVLVFALWYWNLDAGGPHQRELNDQDSTAFLFPQIQIAMTQSSHSSNIMKSWDPNFIDYLFLAFNTSTAFSPTDTPVLSRWAKLTCMLQAMISLTIVVMLAARAINILNPTAGYIVS